MARKFLVLVSLIGGAAVIATSAFGERTGTPTLNGTVGPGYMIALKENGKVVKTLRAAAYKLVIAVHPS